MSNTEQNMLYPFRLSGTRMRRSAVQLRRQGMPLDAVTLLRRAAEQEDTPQAWMTVAAELRQMGCWEAAIRELSRVVDAAGSLPGAWIELARCLRALGQRKLALDCVYHQLHEDPWSAEGDAARELLMDLDSDAEGREPRRTAHLVRNGLTAWTKGDRAAGERRIRRALRITAEKPRLLSTAAMMCMLNMDVQGAAAYLARALRWDGTDSRAMIALSTLLYQMGRPRAARGMLEKAAPWCEGVPGEDAFLTAAWAQDAWPQMEAFLQERMRSLPHRIPLMNAKATMLAETGRLAQAQGLWRDILAIDPDDRQAATRLAASLNGEESRLLPPGVLPAGERKRQNQELRSLIESGARISELLQPGSRSRRIIDWHLTSSDAEEALLVQEWFVKDRDPAAVPYLRTVLARPFVRLDTRQWVLLCMANLGCLEELLMPAGERYTTVQCQRIDPEQKTQSPWKLFLLSFLQETRRWRESREMAEFAASLWPCLTPEQQTQAAGNGRYAWCKAMEVLYLRLTGREALAASVARHTALSRRKISRVLRRLAEHAELE